MKCVFVRVTGGLGRSGYSTKRYGRKKLLQIVKEFSSSFTIHVHARIYTAQTKRLMVALQMTCFIGSHGVSQKVWKGGGSKGTWQRGQKIKDRSYREYKDELK